MKIIQQAKRLLDEWLDDEPTLPPQPTLDEDAIDTIIQYYVGENDKP